ncbi:MAG TPA: recombinase family protein, partial [Coleofasciculaceae cyanobacterium]
MTSLAVWITGPSRSGKTTRLLGQVKTWLEPLDTQDAYSQPGILAFAATGDHRLELTDRLAKATQGKFPVRSTTPLGFFEDEVLLFWSLLADQLDLQTPFPLRLAPETELEFATQLWQPTLDPVIGQQGNVPEARLVRQVLDFLQLGALAGIGIADIPHRLEQGFAGQAELPLPTALIGTLLEQWQTWCLERGLLTYGLITTLYGQQLLPHPIYRQHLIQRFGWLVADDVDEYPAIAGNLFKTLMQAGLTAAFTYNPDGAVRLGLGADPDAMADLSQQCLVESLSDHPVAGLAATWGSTVVDLSLSPFCFTSLPNCFQVIQTGSRGQMLNRATQALIAAIQQGQVQPQEVAMIAPGLDAIARYTVAEQLHQAGIGVESLNDQRPLNSVPMVRALLTLIALVYPGLGRLAERESV